MCQKSAIKAVISAAFRYFILADTPKYNPYNYFMQSPFSGMNPSLFGTPFLIQNRVFLENLVSLSAFLYRTVGF